MAEVPVFKVNKGDEVEVSYQLDYKSAEVKRLADPKNFSHVTTTVNRGEAQGSGLPNSAASHFSIITETVAVTTDDQKVTFKSRVTDIPLDQHVQFPVTAHYSDSTGKTAPGESPITLIKVEIIRPGWS